MVRPPSFQALGGHLPPPQRNCKEIVVLASASQGAGHRSRPDFVGLSRPERDTFTSTGSSARQSASRPRSARHVAAKNSRELLRYATENMPDGCPLYRCPLDPEPYAAAGVKQAQGLKALGRSTCRGPKRIIAEAARDPEMNSRIRFGTADRCAPQIHLLEPSRRLPRRQNGTQQRSPSIMGSNSRSLAHRGPAPAARPAGCPSATSRKP